MIGENRQIIVGGLVVVGLVLMLALSFGRSAIEAPDGYPLKAVFNRVDGLAEGDEVRLAGIRVGTVAEQILDDQFRAVVTFRIDENLKLPMDSSVAIHTDGLFGAKFAVLEPGGEEDLLEPGDEITFTQDAMTVDEILELIISQGRARQRKQSGEGS